MNKSIFVTLTAFIRSKSSTYIYPYIYSSILLLLSLLLLFTPFTPLLSKTKGKKVTKGVVKKLTTKAKQKPSKVKNKTQVKPKSALAKKGVLNFIIDTNTVDNSYAGITYYNLSFKRGKSVNVADIIKVDKEKFNNVKVIKAGNSVRNLERLHKLLGIQDSTNLSFNFLGGVNASFWRAYSNSPIGPTFIDGEPIELKTHKQWSSVFFDINNIPYIDNFEVTGKVQCKELCEFEIDNVNKRKDSLGVVYYNKYYGSELPFVPTEKLDKLLEETLTSFSDALETQDSTEQSFDIEQFRQNQKELEQDKNIEKHLIKIVCEYLEEPVVNKAIKARVVSKNSGIVSIPQNGFIISFGIGYPEDLIPKIGKILTINFSTNTNSDILFSSSISATPRLVSAGVAAHKAYEEGSKGRRFISKDLPRTAFGYNKDKTTMYIVCLEATNDLGTKGVNLERLATIMKLIGCYDAMNFDGGGSSNMIFNGKNRARKSNMFFSRKISVALGVRP